MSKPSEWSSEVKIPNLVNFFVQSSPLGNARSVRFDVFRWDKGTQKQEQFTVAPGDEIGATKNGVDFSTGWTLIDFRLDERQGDWQVLIMNNKEGNIVARSFKADRDDDLYKGLLAQVKLAKDLLANPTGALQLTEAGAIVAQAECCGRVRELPRAAVDQEGVADPVRPLQRGAEVEADFAERPSRPTMAAVPRMLG